jgi:Na+-transporting NADH:ubiquinone oxidoreductase subunit B
MDPLKPIRKGLHETLDKQVKGLEPFFRMPDPKNPKDKGGDFSWLHSTFDGFKTFLFAPESVTKGGTHIKDGIDLKRTMFIVILAMIPALLHGILNVGHMHFVSQGMYTGVFEGMWQKIWYGTVKVLPIVVVAYGAGLGVEFAFAQMRRHPIAEGYLVSGMLIPLVMPPDIPLWMVAMASIFAVIVGKEAFGGTGMNILNVALTARVFIFFAYPTYISGDLVWISDMMDGYSGATPNAILAKSGLTNGLMVPDDGLAVFSTMGQTAGHYSLLDAFFGFIPGSIGEMSVPAILLGAILLIVTGIGSWRIMVTVVAGALFTGLLFNMGAAAGLTAPFLQVPPHYHLFIGSLLFAAVFMATDPVTATQTETGKYIYGFLIGVSGMIIRVINPAYPEGWMLAILFMNVFAPLIDHVVIQANIKRRLARG